MAEPTAHCEFDQSNGQTTPLDEAFDRLYRKIDWVVRRNMIQNVVTMLVLGIVLLLLALVDWLPTE